ncbi:MAG TPA: acylphosphatase [Chitinophagaceae bacterium]|nr:acylphosphatase [Chitinophagaceae bacterium]
MLKTLDITVSGRVQGVFFRQSTREKANALGLKGKVMNLEDGNLRIIVSGEIEKLDQLATWCKKGPPKAKVSSVQQVEIPFIEFDSFRIERN